MAVRRPAARLSHPRQREDRAARGREPAPQEPVDQLDDSFGAERVHHVCLAVDDLDATLAELAERGVPLLGEPFVVEAIGRRLAFVQDNAGNLLELSAPA